MFMKHNCAKKTYETFIFVNLFALTIVLYDHLLIHVYLHTYSQHFTSLMCECEQK